jgi:hypothetical protein
MLDFICNKMLHEGPGAQKPCWPEPRGTSFPDFVPVIFRPRCLLSFDFRNTIPHFSLLPLAVVRCVNSGLHDPELIFFQIIKDANLKYRYNHI